MPIGADPPPAPPYVLHESLVIGGAALSTGFYFFGFCACCAVLGFSTAARGRGAGKWWGARDLQIMRPVDYEGRPREFPDGRAQFSTAAPAVPPAAARFLSTLPPAGARVDPARQRLLLSP